MNGSCLQAPAQPASSNPPLSERREIVNLLDAEPTLDYLVQNGVLTSADVLEISEERDTSQQNRSLLERVESRSDVSGVQLLTNVLRLTGQHYIANLLDDGERIKALSGSGIIPFMFLIRPPGTTVPDGLIFCRRCFFCLFRHGCSELPRPIALKLCQMVGI